MGKEWLNSVWETYAKAHGIKLEFTTPYAHQQNGPKPSNQLKESLEYLS